VLPGLGALAVAMSGNGTITALQFLAALTVIAGVIFGLGRAPQAPAGTVNQAGRRHQPSAETTPVSPQSQPAPSPSISGNEPGTASAPVASLIGDNTRESPGADRALCLHSIRFIPDNGTGTAKRRLGADCQQQAL
jgi:predicted lipid-binding transport protein (Tim44 family)